jgi:serine/threonine-protein kinase
LALLTSRYQLVRKLATGGMAEVFLAKVAGPAGFEKTLVVKRILPQLAARESFVEMFLAEARIAAQLSHQNIVQIFDFGEEDGAWFISMEFIDGLNLRSLSRWLREVGPISPALAARIVMEACEGLAYAHEFGNPATGEPLGLVHRDVSPENIMLTRTGGVKVLDFGIARVQGEDNGTRSGLLKGKIAYMPVEQLRAEELDRRADVYALGVVLYQLLSGHRPWEKGSEVALITAILNDPPTPLTAWVPRAPPALVAIVERATARDRDLRFADCRALRKALEKFVASTGTPVTTNDLAQMAGRALEAEVVRQATAGSDSRSGSASGSSSGGSRVDSRSGLSGNSRSAVSLDLDFSSDEHTEPGLEVAPVPALPSLAARPRPSRRWRHPPRTSTLLTSRRPRSTCCRLVVPRAPRLHPPWCPRVRRAH